VLCNVLCSFVGLYDAVSWQLGLVEREINELLHGGVSQRPAVRQPEPAAPADNDSTPGPAAGTVPQREISDDDICPICQEELLANHRPVTFCRSARLYLPPAFAVNKHPKVIWQKASPPNSSFVFARWQHGTDGLAAVCNYMIWLGVLPPKSPLTL